MKIDNVMCQSVNHIKPNRQIIKKTKHLLVFDNTETKNPQTLNPPGLQEVRIQDKEFHGKQMGQPNS